MDTINNQKNKNSPIERKLLVEGNFQLGAFLCKNHVKSPNPACRRKYLSKTHSRKETDYECNVDGQGHLYPNQQSSYGQFIPIGYLFVVVCGVCTYGNDKEAD